MWVEVVVLSSRVESNVKIGVFSGVKNSQNVVIKKWVPKVLRKIGKAKMKISPRFHLLFMPW